jgi:hypothetical protein
MRRKKVGKQRRRRTDSYVADNAGVKRLGFLGRILGV